MTRSGKVKLAVVFQRGLRYSRSEERDLLDPTLDIVFKLLLLRNQALLRDMIEAVLNPPVPIQDLVVLNPEIPKDYPGDKTIVLDIRIHPTESLTQSSTA